MLKNIYHRWYLPILALLAIGLPILSVRSNIQPGLASPATPIWGRKPVLAYFFLNPELAEKARTELGLTEAQFQAVSGIAKQESRQINDLDRSSQPILQNRQLSLDEKRSQIADIQYNQQVTHITSASRQSVESILDAQTYLRFVDWINQQWNLERELHQNPQSVTAGRSYTVFATRYDAGGAYTVALPDKCIKFANSGAQRCSSGYEFGQNYSVKIAYGNKSVKVTVGESGPWNVDDNFWATVNDPQPRRLFTDLPLGMPEAQAAYYDNYNSGLDQYGRVVTAPFAIDLSYDVSRDLGLGDSQNDWVTVTFLWTDSWASVPTDVITVNSPTTLQPAYSGDMCGSAWHKISGFNGNSAYLTLNVNDASQSTNWGEWYPTLPVAGKYKVEAFIPDHAPIAWDCPSLSIPRDTSDAHYTIYHANGKTNVTGNQAPLANQWLDLGTYQFNAGSKGGVKLVDLTSESSLSRTVSFSAMRFILQVPPTPVPQPTNTPVPTPTPTPLPPAVWAETVSIQPSTNITVPVQALHLPAPGLGSATIDIRYDPAVVSALNCQANPNGTFDSGSCDVNFEHDGTNPDVIQMNLSSASGVTGDPLLANLAFQTVGNPGEASTLEVIPQSFLDPSGTAIPVVSGNGMICLSPCWRITYLPWIAHFFGITP